MFLTAESLLLPFRVLDGDSNPEVAARFIEAARLLWEESGNPVYAWAAYRDCRAARLEVPDWVVRYLDRVAEGMMDLWDAPPNKNNIASAAAKVLEINRSGAGSVFSQAKQAKWIWLGANVDRRLKHGAKEYFAIADEAKASGASPATVRRAWLRYQATFIKSGTS